MFVFEIFGGELEIIPSDIIDLTGFTDMTYTFALPLVLASFGTSMSISGLKSEGKAVLTAVLAVACIVGLGVIAGFTFMDLRTAIYGPIEVAGGRTGRSDVPDGAARKVRHREPCAGAGLCARALPELRLPHKKCQLPLRLRRDRRGEELIGIHAHLDTVPAGEGWSCSPLPGRSRTDSSTAAAWRTTKAPPSPGVYAIRGLLTINAGQLAVEEGEVRVYFDIRYPVTASGETVLARMRAAAAPYGLRVWKRHEMRPVYMDKNSRVIRRPACGIPRTDRRHGRAARGGQRHLCPRDEEHRGLWPRPPLLDLRG